MPWNLGYREKITHGIVGASEVSSAPVPVPISLPPQRRRIYVLRSDIERFGPSEGCAACAAIIAGDRDHKPPHDEDCRNRIVELLEREEAGAERIRQWRARRGLESPEAAAEPAQCQDVKDSSISSSSSSSRDGQDPPFVDADEAVGAPEGDKREIETETDTIAKRRKDNEGKWLESGLR